MSKVSKLFAGLAVGLLVVGVAASPASAAALTSAQVSAIISLLQSFGADAATIANVNASLTGGAPVAPAPSTTFTRDLTIGATGADVTALQTWLEAKGFLVMPAGVAKGYFGPLTRSALAAYQASKGIMPAAGYFGPKTRASVAAEGSVVVTPPGTVTPPSGISTPGVEGTLIVDENPTPSSGMTIYEGQTRQGVLGIRLEALNSDLSIQRVKVNLGTNTSIYTKVFSRIYLMDGSTVVAEMPLDSSTVFEEGSTKYVQFTGFNFIVPKNTRKALIVAVDVRPTIDSGDQGSKTIQLADNGVRALDGAGIDQTGPSTGSSVSNAVTVDDSLVDAANLTVSLASNSPLARQVVATDGSNRDEISEVEVAKFNLKATGDAVQVNDWQVTITEAGANAGTPATALLYDGSTLLSTASISSGAATFDDIEFNVPKDTTKTLSVRVKVTGVGNTVIGSLGASTTGGAITAENSEGSTINPSGTASTTAVVFFIDDGLEIELASAPTISAAGVPQGPITGGNSTSTLSAMFNVRLRAVDAPVLLGLAASGTPAFASSTTGFTTYVNGSQNLTISSLATTTSYAKPTSLSETNNTVTLNDGDEVIIPVTYAISGRSTSAGAAVISGQTNQFAVQLEGVQWNSNDGTAYTSSFMSGRTEWRTGGVTFP